MTKSDINPILVTGTFRSGTTLISQIMGAHSKIGMLYDSVNFMRFSYNKYNPIENVNNLNLLLKEIQNRIATRWNLDLDINRILNSLKNIKIDYAEIYNEVMKDCLLKKTSKLIWGEKTTLVWSKIPDFFSMFPNGRVIHIIRDPRAVLCSWKAMTHAPGNDYLDAIFNCVDSMDKMILYKNEFSSYSYQPLLYENLINNPEYAVKMICDRLNIEYEADMLNINNYKSKNGTPWKGNSMFKNIYNQISSETLNIWHSKLENIDIACSDFFTKKLMQKHGYEPNYSQFDNNIKNQIFEHVNKSDLVKESALKYLITENGVERFPTDPLDSRNWEKSSTQATFQQ